MNDNDCFVPKKWSLDIIRKRIENLKKKYNENYINGILRYFLAKTDNECDALYLTYYHIKRCNRRYDASTFGKIRQVEYSEKQYRIVAATGKNAFINKLLESNQNFYSVCRAY